jgi:hypothetical protein
MFLAIIPHISGCLKGDFWWPPTKEKSCFARVVETTKCFCQKALEKGSTSCVCFPSAKVSFVEEIRAKSLYLKSIMNLKSSTLAPSCPYSQP